MNENPISTFYAAFASLNSASMADCYHKNIEFTDPAFGTLKGERACAMWRMLCSSAKDLNIEFSDVNADERFGSANWRATYTFSKTGRKVVNTISANFEFKDGKIIKHTDSFNLHKWASQAMGFRGWLLGRTGFFKRKLQEQTNKTLDRFIDAHES